MAATEFKLRISDKRRLTPDTTAFTLQPSCGEVLPVATPGSHLTIATPGGARRRYSLIKSGSDLLEYQVVVKYENFGLGGSKSLIDDTDIGDEISVQPPENDFPLVDAEHYLFIAGGIGITPIISMIRSLQSTKRIKFKLIYLTRDAEHTVYLQELPALFSNGELVIHHDQGDKDNFYDLWPELENPSDRHIYYCGPTPLMEEIADMIGHWPADTIHFESFEPTVVAVKFNDRSFVIVCQRSNQRIEVAADESALVALRRAGITVASSCESGTCGSCKTTLLAGQVEHRDLVLREDEQDKHLMLCVSRARDKQIVVDL